MEIVRARPNAHYIFPRNIPPLRNDVVAVEVLTTIIFQIIAIFWLPGETIFERALQSLGTFYFCMFLMILAEWVSRLIQITEEKQHLLSRYDGKWANLIKDILCLSSGVQKLIVSFLIFYIIITAFAYDLSAVFGSFLKVPFGVSIISAFIFQKIIKVEECPLRTSLLINRLGDDGIDFGSSMANAYYYGYLKIVLPQYARLKKDISERIEDYINKNSDDNNKVTFKIKKLFVLIPLNCQCNTTLSEFHGIEEKGTLEKIIIHRGGVQDREYHNAVYRITDENSQFVYVSSEYATPLRTMEDIIVNNSPHAEIYKKYKKEIVLQFYLTLHAILKHYDHLRFCELVFYNDQDPTGQQYNVADILLERIHKLENNIAD